MDRIQELPLLEETRKVDRVLLGFIVTQVRRTQEYQLHSIQLYKAQCLLSIYEKTLQCHRNIAT